MSGAIRPEAARNPRTRVRRFVAPCALLLAACWSSSSTGDRSEGAGPIEPVALAPEVPKDDEGIDAARLLVEALAAAEISTRSSVPAADAIAVLTTQLASAHRDDAVEELSEACGLGDAEACLVAGARSQDGTAEGFEAMLDHWQMGCAQGHAEACGWLVAALARAEGLAFAPRRLDAPCARGSLAACAALGWAVRDDPERARALLEPGCEQDRGDACLYLAGVAATSAERGRAFERACAAGEPRGCVGQGMTSHAVGDRDEARRAFELACRDGIPEGCTALAALLWHAEEDAEERRRLLRTACEAQSAAACHALAADPLEEEDPLDRFAAATPWYVTACTLGRGAACHAFAQRLRTLEVEGTGRDMVDELTRRACVDGIAAACDLLASPPQNE